MTLASHTRPISQHAARIARDHCLAPERVDAPIYGGRYRSLFPELPALEADEAALHGGQYAVVTPRSGYEYLPEALRETLPGDLAERVDVLGVDEVKGLEFDGVTVVDPQAVLEGSRRGVNDLYVALTRPTQRLTVLHHGTLPPGLDRLLD